MKLIEDLSLFFLMLFCHEMIHIYTGLFFGGEVIEYRFPLDILWTNLDKMEYIPMLMTPILLPFIFFGYNKRKSMFLGLIFSIKDFLRVVTFL